MRQENAPARIHEQTRLVRFTWVPSHTTPDSVMNGKVAYKKRLA